MIALTAKGVFLLGQLPLVSRVNDSLEGALYTQVLIVVVSWLDQLLSLDTRVYVNTIVCCCSKS